MTPAQRRFDHYRSMYRAAVPLSNNSLSRKRRRELDWAAALTVTIETTLREIAMGLRGEQPPELKLMRAQVGEHLAAAHSLTTLKEAMRTKHA